MTFIKYLKYRSIYTLIVAYFILSIFLKLFNGINILLPCIWKKIFGHECIGCGLTRACIQLIQLNFKEAYSCNKFIFLVLIIIIVLIIRDIKQFLNNLNY